MAESKYRQYILTDLKSHMSPEALARYNEWATKLLWIDDKAVPGAFQMNTAWYRKAHLKSPPAHWHDVPEILGFFGSDPENPHELNGEIEFWIEDEKFIFTKSTMVFMPPNVKHCPLILHRIDRPVFHFTTVTAGTYEIQQEEQKTQ